MFYDYGMLEVWAASASEQTSLAPQKTVETDSSAAEDNEASSTKGFLPLVISTCLLLTCAAGMAWGTVKLWQGVTMLEAYLSPVPQLERQDPHQ